MRDSDDIDALIDELHASTGAAAARPGNALGIEALLATVVERRGSDLLLVAGSPPAARIDGLVVRLAGDLLDGTDIEEAVLPLLPPHARQQYLHSGTADASLRVAGLGRFRVNLHRERGRAAAAIRALPGQVPRLADLHLPPEVDALSRLSRGLVLIGGATGS
ncbi:MAG: type IV pili twitching motility protein PilT, partial [Vicinamibacteria bacterium]